MTGVPRQNQTSRRAWWSAAFLLAVVIAGATLWWQTRSNGHTNPGPGNPAAQSAGGALPTGLAPLGTISNAVLDPTRSGPVAFTHVGERQVTYAEEVNLLELCGAQSGSTEVLYASSWGMSASVFGCRDATAAQEFVAAMRTVEVAALGYRQDADPATLVSSYSRTTNPGNPTFPDQVHLRYRSGSLVVGIALQAKTPAALHDAENAVLASALAAIATKG